MKIFFAPVFLIIILLSVTSVCEGKDKNKETPPWMEDVLTGERKVYLVPKGAKKEVFGSQVIVEATEEYVARRIYEFEQLLDDQMQETDKKFNDLSVELEDLKKTIKQLEQEIARTSTETAQKDSVATGESEEGE